jgi:hypothetical protein
VIAAPRQRIDPLDAVDADAQRMAKSADLAAGMHEVAFVNR